MNPRVSVIVPTCGRTESLRRCLDALLHQDFETNAYEILVADDADSGGTRNLVEEFGCRDAHEKHAPVRYVPVTGRHGPAAARNAGLRASCAEIIAFTDDDCVPQPGWLRAGVSAFVDGIAAASGRVIVPVSRNATDYEINVSRLALSEFVTASCFYRRNALKTIGGFDERFTMAWREDSDLFFRLLKKNMKFTYAPEAVVVHPVRPVSWGVSVAQQRKNMFNALLYKKHSDFYRERLKPVVPWHYYILLAALVLGVAGVAGRNVVAAVLGVGTWSAVTGYFCALRLRNAAHTPTHIFEMVVTSMIIPPVSIFWRIVGAIRYRVLFL